MTEGTTHEDTSKRKTSRKQWSVQGEPKSILKRLRSQLAEDGCPESQYLISKYLLEDENDANYEENAKQAVFYLTQASLQGSTDASNLLKECLEKGLGITDRNVEEVVKALEMNQEEKLALAAGRKLFNSLAEGSEWISKRELSLHFERILNESTESEDSVTSNGGTFRISAPCSFAPSCMNLPLERFSVDRIISTCEEFVRGDEPSIDISERSHRRRSTLWNFGSVGISYKALSIVSFTVPFSLLVFYYLFSYRKVTSITAIHYLYLVSCSMLSYSLTSVMKRFKSKKGFFLWANVLKHYSPELNVDLATKKFNGKTIMFCVCYFCSVILYLMLLPFVNPVIKSLYIPPLTVLSVCVLTSSFRANFFFYLISSFSYVFSHYSSGQDRLRKGLESLMPSLSPYLTDKSFRIYGALNWNIDLSSVFHGLWVVSLGFVSLDIGALNVLFHVISVTCFHLTVVTLNDDHLVPSLYASIVFWVLVAFWPQITRVVPLLIGGLGLFYCCYVSGMSCALTMFTGGTFSCLLLFTHLRNMKTPYSGLNYVYAFISVAAILTVLSSPWDAMNASVSSLTWDQYHNVCYPSKEPTDIHLIRHCKSFEGTVINWQATVKRIDIENVSNTVEWFLSIFPRPVYNQLSCLFSDSSSCDDLAIERDRHRCLFIREAKGFNNCSLEDWNRYSFHMTAVMESNFWKFTKTSEVILKVPEEFQESIFQLSVDDKISFVGTLTRDLGSFNPKISLTNFQCVDCRGKNVSTTLQPPAGIFNPENLIKSAKFAFNFLLGPTITISQS